MHRTVLLNEVIDGLNLGSGSIVVDATFGGGGHSLEICKRYPSVRIIALDQDQSALEKAKSKFKDSNCDVTFINANFRDLDRVNLGNLSVVGSLSSGLRGRRRKNFPSSPVDGIIFDLGLSSDQLENSGRGFSFQKDEPLLMTMKENPTSGDVTAKDVVNTWGEDSLADIIYGYGEEKQARRIAKRIVEFRKKQEIKTTFDLVKVIEEAIPAKFRKGKIHYATKTFQAIRIAVNDELGALAEGLDKGFKLLKVGGRMSVISFHSLEDRIVKRFFKKKAEENLAKLINKKPIIAKLEEIKNNPRSRSAKLRILSRR
ncbi:16S rRNA (cytosine(1402)-N(4))-methyltransferase [Candidatus Nomurabacteria bacterium RIFCSPHIGHO2_01_FULL_37_25]|uniref:Ribosomal RNA small subunit methyltransferase H n=1 Tax=Candidatus Nomurabacteria bacterium RIFCSPLOWO2_01_FULL_36_16 TaxID=1801767 RepID=A0A1F6X0B7_9BACT|nr:MAG: 16S rRNA (cytosine(1402)-N(4))-methyltransferase [Candidatus Nomurabacteria bacterium RIFCSPHIGHO2_01_FULL_37_25]OGI75059.1 MAG: 16S rRNA (cytosine(1402)-N(4))-methyltransferase [Candidatus Nomurabacteria bacterium RIFCSPHIGHO2_02_FULL_36_29]OGI87570.1 MAG: 16S rRNA (cytosine(1402)-N(4))-methyltransferase [Candidatus Nomurabacteria bacterium RIFCSPLOWO2_01_FULL_36_16]OGI96465.1 MAG: 16S rRNA (cytosine(1402)-N(4))-methyltransferase [Candidatus Nomurabacteria bacterium RIFCSPLOWO2_02_FULL_